MQMSNNTSTAKYVNKEVRPAHCISGVFVPFWQEYIAKKGLVNPRSDDNSIVSDLTSYLKKTNSENKLEQKDFLERERERERESDRKHCVKNYCEKCW